MAEPCRVPPDSLIAAPAAARRHLNNPNSDDNSPNAPSRSDHPHLGSVIARYKHRRRSVPGYVALPELGPAHDGRTFAGRQRRLSRPALRCGNRLDDAALNLSEIYLSLNQRDRLQQVLQKTRLRRLRLT